VLLSLVSFVTVFCGCLVENCDTLSFIELSTLCNERLNSLQLSGNRTYLSEMDYFVIRLLSVFMITSFCLPLVGDLFYRSREHVNIVDSILL